MSDKRMTTGRGPMQFHGVEDKRRWFERLMDDSVEILPGNIDAEAIWGPDAEIHEALRRGAKP